MEISLTDIQTATPAALRITFRALCKAVTYAKLVCQYFGDSEYIGFLLSDPTTDPDLVDDVLLAPNQTATAASVEIDAKAVLEAGREIRAAGKRARGWCHSHSRMATFHSCIDDSTTRKLLHELAPANVVEVPVEMPVKVKRTPSGLELYEKSRLIGTVEHESLAGSDEEQQDSVIRRIVPVAAVYSLVVNKRGDTYAEIATKHMCPICNRAIVKAERVELDVVQMEDGPALDVAEMRAEVRERVSASRWKSGYCGSQSYGSDYYGKHSPGCYSGSSAHARDDYGERRDNGRREGGGYE